MNHEEVNDKLEEEYAEEIETTLQEIINLVHNEKMDLIDAMKKVLEGRSLYVNMKVLDMVNEIINKNKYGKA